MLSCGLVKTELFENADVTASIYNQSEHAHRPLGITQGHFDFLFAFVKARRTEFESKKRLREDGDFFENAPRVDADIFYTDKKDAYSKISRYVWTRPNVKRKVFFTSFREPMYHENSEESSGFLLQQN